MRAPSLGKGYHERMDWPTLEEDHYLDLGAPGDIRLRGTRVDLCVIVEDYLDGHLPEHMVVDYPTLELEAVYGAIAYYLRHREAVDRYVESCRQRADRMYAEHQKRPVAPVVQRLREMKART